MGKSNLSNVNDLMNLAVTKDPTDYNLGHPTIQDK